ncbi:MAG TPA: hypothetical protein VGA18_04290 [Rhodothermales bacterium]
MTGKSQSIFLGAMVVGLLATIFGMVQFSAQSQVLGSVACCVIPTVGALVATWHYTSTNTLTIRAGEGAMIGLAACIIGYFVSLVLSLLVSYTGLMPSPFDVEAVIEMTQESMVDSGSSQAEIDQAIGFMREFFFVFVMVGIVAYGVLGAVVGAIGARLFKRGEPDMDLGAPEME